jgi:hypothetical protein
VPIEYLVLCRFSINSVSGFALARPISVYSGSKPVFSGIKVRTLNPKNENSLSQHVSTDRQTDRQTDGQTINRGSLVSIGPR